MRWYLAGPMTGIEDFNYAEFNRVADTLRNTGLEVYNPAAHFGGDRTQPRNNYLNAAIAGVSMCDGIAVLPGWDTHKHPDGQHSFAVVEVAFGHALGMPIVPWRELLAKNGTTHVRSGYRVGGQEENAEVETTPGGGKHSRIPYRCDLLPAAALLEASRVLHEGARKYNDGNDDDPNWRRIPVRDHLNHLLTHVFAHLCGDKETDHLTHALCRAMFAVDLEVNP